MRHPVPPGDGFFAEITGALRGVPTTGGSRPSTGTLA